MKKLVLVVCAWLCVGFAKADEGMWLLSRLKQQNIEEMQAMGFRLTAEDIYSVNQPGIKDAIVGLGYAGSPFRHFCSGEIVSPQGLLITNHHCGFGAIQAHSSVEHDYLSDGFWAYKMEDELTNPGMTASILDRMEEVTDRVKSVLNDDMSEDERGNAIDSISKIIIKEAEEGGNAKAQVISMFEGNQYFLFLYTIYKDVRLVGAPPQSLGKFGGDTDNWMWPRHTCDFSMFRIYTAPDGTPAEYAEENVPLKPKHYLPVSIKGVKDGDFAMIMGFPGSTDRFATSFSLKNTMTGNDIRYNVRTVKLGIMKAEMEKDPKTRIQYASKHASCANYWKYSYEQNKALKQLNTLENKQAIEREFSEWVNADAGRKARYGEVLANLEKAYGEMAKYLSVQSYLVEALRGTETPGLAYRVNRLAEKWCDKSTSEEEKAKTLESLKKAGADFYKNFNPDVEEKWYAALYKMYNDNVDPEYHSEIINLVNKKYKGDYAKFAADVRKKSIFMDEQRFNAFAQQPDCKQLKNDLAVVAGRSFYEILFKLRAYVGDLGELATKNDRLFVEGLMQMDPDKRWAPNANSTLRLTYGKVRSYKPRDAVFYDYYTTLDGVIQKEGAKGTEFEVPARLKELYANKDFGQYGEDNVVACFITDSDITGGNSGSPVINADGELIGAAFDGNSEAMSGDIDFEENLQRCINVDMRYVLFIIDKYAGAKNLIDEMTIVK
ncbi:S46 family peptidase [Odoribacter lunatus]|uniref:S46 family peptidase n=1 Tax=Odoribacter lunatus TaxID=2941335 RepID=UPI00203B369A|nr:S46 family peptidase [Odoribacter lunatus]